MSCEAPSARSDHAPHLCGSRWPQACWPPWQKAPWTANRCACCLSRNSTSCAFEEADLRWAQKSSEMTRSARPLFTRLPGNDFSYFSFIFLMFFFIGSDVHSYFIPFFYKK